MSIQIHPSAVPLNTYLERLDGIRERFEAVVTRRMNYASYPERVCLSLGYAVAFIDRVHPAAEDLAVWTRAHRVLGGAV